MDVYRPAAANAPAPALIFFNQAVGPERTNGFYVDWARAAASKGLVAIVPDLHGGDGSVRDVQRLIAHLSEQGGTYGIDREAIAVYAGSGNVYTAFPIVEDPKQTTVKAAVMYYGTAPITEFRRDLPVLYVRAGPDRPGVNGNATSGITRLAALAISQNAPITLLNHPIGHHAFEMVDDDAGTRDVIDRTIDFVQRATAAPYQAALRRALPEAAAAAHVITGEYGAAAAEYANVLASRPDDLRLRLSYGEALLGDKQYATACGEFDRLRGKGLGPRDLGLPATRACLLKGDSAAAVAWLQTIPKRFLPPSLQQDTAFAALRTRADFRALFQPLNH
jgi:dienelactone hydrolase